MAFTITKLVIDGGTASSVMLDNGTITVEVSNLGGTVEYNISGTAAPQVEIDNADTDLAAIGNLVTYSNVTSFNTKIDDQVGSNDIQTYLY